MAHHHDHPAQLRTGEWGGLAQAARVNVGYEPTRRRRYFAYGRRSGETCYVDKAQHQHLQRYPHTIAYYQLSRWLGTSALLTAEQAAVKGWLSKSSMSAL